MKKLKETAALKIGFFNTMIKHHAEKYLRYCSLWHDRCNLGHEDPEKFTKLESDSGSAMWDDPPEDWSERDLMIWSMGNAHGREVECMNASSMLYHLEHLSSELTNNNYGFREGVPTLDQIEVHSNRNLLGIWMILIAHEGDDFVRRYPVMMLLKVAKKKIQYWNDKTGKYANLTKKDQKEMLEFMPVGDGGIPSSWNKLKFGKKKNG
jgi:hypothetical protein